MLKLIILCYGFVGLAAAADDGAVAIVNSVSGKVNVRRIDFSLRPATPGSKLIVGDSIETSEQSTARIMTEDKNSFFINEKSKFKIQSYHKVSQVSGSTLINFEGAVRAQIVRKYNDSDSTFRIVTPVAVAGVRGTDFFLEQANQKLRLTTFTGEVAIGERFDGTKIVSPIMVGSGKQFLGQSGLLNSDGIRTLSRAELGKIDSDSKRLRKSESLDFETKHQDHESKEKKQKSKH